LVGLFAGDGKSLNEMLNCRVNPFEGGPRNDLEFFIPQLCGYLLDTAKPKILREKLFYIMTQAANACYNFSHQLYFFLQTYTSDLRLKRCSLTV